MRRSSNMSHIRHLALIMNEMLLAPGNVARNAEINRTSNLILSGPSFSFFTFLFEITLINNNTLKVCFCVINLKTITYTKPDITLFSNLDLLFAIFFAPVIQTIHFFYPVGWFLSFSKGKCLAVKGLNNRDLSITNLRFEPCFSMILSISCNLKSENDGFKRFLIFNRT